MVMSHSENRGGQASGKLGLGSPRFTASQMQSAADWIIMPKQVAISAIPQPAASSHLSISPSSSLCEIDTQETSLAKDCAHVAPINTRPVFLADTTGSTNTATPIDNAQGRSNILTKHTSGEEHSENFSESKNKHDIEKISVRTSSCAAIREDGKTPQAQMTASKAINRTGKRPKVDAKSNPYLVHQDLDTSSRKLLTVRKVQKVRGLRLKNMEAVTVDGRTVLAFSASQFRPGDFVLFLELGTFVPGNDTRFQDLSRLNNGQGIYDGQPGYLLVPRFAGPFEQLQDLNEGFIFKLSRFPEIKNEMYQMRRTKKAASGTLLKQIREIDYSSRFGITELRISKDSTMLGKLPFFLRSTDSKRLKECPNLFIKRKYRKHIYQESVKMDGQSMTCYFVTKNSPFFKFLNPLPSHYDSRAVHPNGRFGVCSKNVELGSCVSSAYWSMAIAEGLPDKLAKLGKSIAVMGELVGHNITGNRHGYGKGEYDFFVFSLFDIDDQVPWSPPRVEEFAAEQGLRHVPVRGYVTLHNIASCHKDIQNRADLTSHEGLVYKNTFDGRWFKVLSQPYLERVGKEPASVVTSESQTMPQEELEEQARIWSNTHSSDTDTMKRIWEKATWEEQINEYCSMWAEAILANARETDPAALKDKHDE